MNVSIDDIDAFVFDCDGVLTNNYVYQDENGIESVRFSRSDGLAFDALKKLKKPSFILSTEKNPVVTARAKKLNIEAIQGIGDKSKAIRKLAKNNNYALNKIIYVGNDINDYDVMLSVGMSACPSDSHQMIKAISPIHLKSKGGEGIVRELLEKVFELNLKEILF